MLNRMAIEKLLPATASASVGHAAHQPLFEAKGI
jgi:hypothetical protein